MPRSHWRASDIQDSPERPASILPVITPGAGIVVSPDLDYWDMWPLQTPSGATADIDGRSWWFFLASPKFDDPEARHDHARIRLVTHGRDGWRDRGHLLPDDLAPGTREWSGSAVLGDDLASVTLYFTAAGRREGGARFAQRLFETTGTLDRLGCRIGAWSDPAESVAADGSLYAVADEDAATDGMIQGFRDPSFFRDPHDGEEYLLFTANAAREDVAHTGVIGAARRVSGRWSLMPPLIDAVGVNNELERPQIVPSNGAYYLFWSTHGKRFAPAIRARSGLYGMVADSVAGPWRPLNGSGLVAGNPDAEPEQAYCWFVTQDLDVISFVNYPNLEGRKADGDAAFTRSAFGGTIAPVFRIILEGDETSIAPASSRL